MNFELLLVSLTAISGLIFLADYFYKKDGKNHLKKRSFLVEQAVSFFPIFLIVLIFRSFIFEPFRIPSSSMMPTLLIGDRVFVAEDTYGFSRHSFPFSPNVISERLFYKKREKRI